MRGVHAMHLTFITMDLGSSPHARGPLEKMVAMSNEERIIPACAGSTPKAGGRGQHLQDHPRMRGVHLWPQPVHL